MNSAQIVRLPKKSETLEDYEDTKKE